MVVRINGTDYNVITTWDQVDIEKILKCETFRDELKALTDIPAYIIDNADDLQLFPIYTLLGFLDDFEAIPVTECYDVALRSYERSNSPSAERKRGNHIKSSSK